MPLHRVLIIGCGAIAGGYDEDRPSGDPPLTHAGAFSRDPRFALSACVDPDEHARARFAERWGVAQQASDIDGLGADAGAFDVIAICSPTGLHAGHLEAALKLRPRLIFCEKPLAASLAEAERLARACEDAGVALAVNYTRRWAPDLVELADQLAGGKWGRVLAAVGHYAKGIVHNGGHMIDLLHMLLGPLELLAAGARRFDHWQDDPSVPALLATEDGASVHLVPGDARAYTQFELVLTTELGEIAMRDGGRRIETRRVEDSDVFAGYGEIGRPEISQGRYAEAMAAAVDNIAAALDGAKRLASTGRNALAAQRLCEAVRGASLELLKDNGS